MEAVRCGTTWMTCARLRVTSWSAASNCTETSDAQRTLDKCIVRVQRRKVVALFDGEFAPLELAADRIAVVEDEDVLQGRDVSAVA